MTAKSLVTGVASAAVGVSALVVAVGATSVGPTPMVGRPAVYQVQPAALGAPLPLDQTASLPSADQLSSVLNGLADPNVPFANKSGLVEGGISSGQAAIADHEIKKAAKEGELPLTFTVSNIQPASANATTADVAISGPKLRPPVNENLTFVNQGSWVLSHDSAMTLVEAVSDSGG
jgi:hypothetical protein